MKRDTSRRRFRNPMTVLAVTGKSANKRGRTSFWFTISICSKQCDYSMKRQRFYCFRCFAQSTDIHLSGKTAKLHDWPIMGSQLLVQWTTSYYLSYQDWSSIPAAARLQHRDQRISEIVPEIWDHYQIQWRLEVTNMHAGNRCWQILTSRPRETVNRHTTIFSDELYKEDPTQGIPDWLQPFTFNLEDLETCARTFLWKSELRFGKWDFKKWRHKNEAQCSVSLPQIPKEIYSTNRRVWWLDNSRAQKRISEQSPGRCLGTRSHYSVDTTRVKPKLHRRRRRILWKFSEPSQKPKVFFMYDLSEFGKWRIITESSPHCSETRNCRTSCTSSKRRNISRIIAIWIEWKVVVRFHEMLLTICRMSKTYWQTWNLNMNWDSKDQLYYSTHWLDISQTPRETKQEFFNLKEIITRNFIGYALFAERNLGGRYSDYWCWRIGKFWRHQNIFQKTECERSLDNPKIWRICISCGRWFSKIIRERLRIPRTHSQTGNHCEEMRISAENFMAIGKSFNLKKQNMTKESIRILGLTQKLGKWTEKFNCTCREKNRILFHWVTLISSGQLMPDLEIAQEKPIDYSWNVDGNRYLTDSWTDFTRFTLLNETPQKRVWPTRREIDEYWDNITFRSCMAWPLLTRIWESEHAFGKLLFQNNKRRSLWSKIHLCLYCRGKDGILCSLAIWYMNSFQWKDQRKALDQLFLLLRWKLAHVVSSRDTAYLWDKNSSSNPKTRGITRYSQVRTWEEKKYKLRMLFCSAESRGVHTNAGGEHTNKIWLLGNPENVRKIFHLKQYWFQTQWQQW